MLKNRVCQIAITGVAGGIAVYCVINHIKKSRSVFLSNHYSPVSAVDIQLDDDCQYPDISLPIDMKDEFFHCIERTIHNLKLKNLDQLNIIDNSQVELMHSSNGNCYCVGEGVSYKVYLCWMGEKLVALKLAKSVCMRTEDVLKDAIQLKDGCLSLGKNCVEFYGLLIVPFAAPEYRQLALVVQYVPGVCTLNQLLFDSYAGKEAKLLLKHIRTIKRNACCENILVLMNSDKSFRGVVNQFSNFDSFSNALVCNTCR